MLLPAIPQSPVNPRPLSPELREYLCPGERLPISHAVHLGRIRNGYASCRTCPLRDPTAAVPAVRSCGELTGLWQRDGVRGVWQNEVTQEVVERLAAAFAAMLWDRPETGRRETGRPAGTPTVVVAYDERPWSPRIAQWAGRELRRRGCETIDIGSATSPLFHFAVRHLEATGGLLAAGAGQGIAAAGLDFALQAGRPLSLGAGLDRLRIRSQSKPDRPTRIGGGGREFDPTSPYETGLWRHFRAFCPAIGVVGSASAAMIRRVKRLNEELATELHTLQLPRGNSSAIGGSGVPLERMQAAVRERKADFGLWIGEDGAIATALDDTGALIPGLTLVGLLLRAVLVERPGSTVATSWEAAESLAKLIPGAGGELARGEATREGLWATAADHRAAAAADADGQFLLSEGTADALLLLARLLRVIGPDGRKLSQLAAEISHSA